MSERDEFEKWARDTYGEAVDLMGTGDVYSCPFTMALFTGWQAARRWRPIEEAPDE